MIKRNYKATMVLDPKSSQGGADEMISALSDVVRSVDGEVTKVQTLGTQNLARPANRKSLTGHDGQFEIEGDTEVPTRSSIKLSLAKKVARIVVERI